MGKQNNKEEKTDREWNITKVGISNSEHAVSLVLCTIIGCRTRSIGPSPLTICCLNTNIEQYADTQHHGGGKERSSGVHTAKLPSFQFRISQNSFHTDANFCNKVTALKVSHCKGSKCISSRTKDAASDSACIVLNYKIVNNELVGM